MSSSEPSSVPPGEPGPLEPLENIEERAESAGHLRRAGRASRDEETKMTTVERDANKNRPNPKKSTENDQRYVKKDAVHPGLSR